MNKECWDEPVFLESNEITTPWAGNRMKKYRKDVSVDTGTIREVCSYKTLSNRILSSKHQGELLRDILDDHATEIMGKTMGDQMIRIAYIDALEDLSLQVHPDDVYAKKYEQDFEKSESWYILDCSDDAYVIAGTTLLTKDELLSSIKQETVMDHMLRIQVHPQDFVMIPCHLIHACGGNILALEIGSFGGITYRLYDYGRGRQLDLEAGLKNVDLNARATIKNYPYVYQKETKRISAIQHSLFHVDILDVCIHTTIEGNGYYQILTSVQGDFMLHMNHKQYSLDMSKTVILPALISSCMIVGSGRILISYQPIK